MVFKNRDKASITALKTVRCEIYPEKQLKDIKNYFYLFFIYNKHCSEIHIIHKLIYNVMRTYKYGDHKNR